MENMDYNPLPDLNRIFRSPEALDELPELIEYTARHKQYLNDRIEQEITEYKGPSDLKVDIEKLMQLTRETRVKSFDTQSQITNITSSMEDLDRCKKNLVLSMTVIKRLQMLVKAYNDLTEIIPEHNYQDIYKLLSVVNELVLFFQKYKSVDEINQLNMMIIRLQNKLVDDIFIDFEDSIKTNLGQKNDKLLYGCRILEIVDAKYKDKVLNLFYNTQLKEIKTIFNNSDEAGSLDNLNRRYMYFNNVLGQIESRYLKLFPPEWHVELQLCKIFCELTESDLPRLLNSQISSEVLLDSLLKTLDFEKSLNEKFDTNMFDHSISRVFETHLGIWVKEQQRLLQSKFMEFLSYPKIPQEFSTTDRIDDFMNILRVNNVPNISNSSIELFKTFHKILANTLKLSNGKILVSLSNVFIDTLYDYNNRILAPIISTSLENTHGIDPIKYLTMVINTGDYVINNINDLQEKIQNLINEDNIDLKGFERSKDVYYQSINNATKALLSKLSEDLKFAWRVFANKNWAGVESVSETSEYMKDLLKNLIDDVKVIIPLIIRDSYYKNFCNKVVELMCNSFLSNIKQIRPLSILTIEQLQFDLLELKENMLELPLYSNPNFSNSREPTEAVSNIYKKFVERHFEKVDAVLRMLTSPNYPVDNLIENYFHLIGDKSVRNFTKILHLKAIDPSQQAKYIDNFRLQLSLDNNLIDELPLLAALDIDDSRRKEKTSEFQPRQSTPEMKSPKLGAPNLKINALEKNLRELALNGENQVSKLNENFKNFGKFFRKENSNE